VYVCEVCGSEHVQWVGRCPTCKEWNCVKPFKVRREQGSSPSRVSRAAAASVSAGARGGGRGGQVVIRSSAVWEAVPSEGAGVPGGFPRKDLPLPHSSRKWAKPKSKEECRCLARNSPVCSAAASCPGAW
ncbi:unnamed protein product, partial [Ectocarpus sp. 13 AM-2016]